MSKSQAAAGENIPPEKPASHAVEDETQEDEGIVAVVSVHIFHHPLTHLSKIAGFGKLALVHKAGPWSNGRATPVDPLFGHTD